MNIEEAFAQSVPLSEAWPEPDPLISEIAEADVYPLDALPPVILAAAREVSRFNKVPVVSPAVAGLSVTATAIGKKARVEERRGLVHNLALFQVIIAASGERKSPVFRHMSKPLDDWDTDHETEWQESCREIAAANAIAEKLAKQLENEAKGEITEIGRENLISRIAAERGRVQSLPPSPRLYSTDTTEERLFQLMHDRKGAFAVLSGEGRPVIDGIIGRRSGEGYMGDAIYLAGVSGDAITRDRVGGNGGGPESRKIPLPMLNVCIMVQPDKYIEAARHPRLRASGAVARIWPVWPPSLIGKRLESENEAGLDEQQLAPFYAAVRQILETPELRDDEGRDTSHVIRLGQEAADARREWHNLIETMMGEGHELEDVRDIAAKAVSATVKAAGVLHILMDPGNLTRAESEIGLDTWRRAQLLGEFHLSEAIRIQRAAEERNQDHAAVRVLGWIVGKQIKQFKRRDLMQTGPRPRLAQPEADDVCELLHAHGYIRPLPSQALHRNPTYEVRPDVATVANVARGSA